MSRVASTLVWLSTSLWFGGMIFLFVSVQTLFRAFPRPASDVAPQAAPALFDVFERYQLALAAAALIGAFVWYLAVRSKRVIVIFAMLAIAAAGAAISTTLITPPMQQLRAAGQTASPRFRALHGRSMQCYLAQAGLLLVVTLLLPAAPRTKASKLVGADADSA